MGLVLAEGQWLGVTQRFWLTWGVGQDEPLLNCGCGVGVGRGIVAGSGFGVGRGKVAGSNVEILVDLGRGAR